MSLCQLIQIVLCFWIVLLLSQNKADDPSPCSPREAIGFLKKWERLKHEVTPRGHRAIFRTIIEEVERQDKNLGKELRTLLESVSGYHVISKVELYLFLLTKPEILDAQLIYDIRRHPDWARRALTIIPMTRGAVNRVFTKVLDPRQSDWRRCLAHFGKTVMRTLATAALSAECRILNTSGLPLHSIEGTVSFSRKLVGGLTTVSVNIHGFNSNNTQHGFHIHKFGRMGNDCNEAGPHYNPMDKDHGAPYDEERHVGDLGNIMVDERGRVITTIQDHLLELSGPNSIVGRSVVVHAYVDDLGLGGYPDSKTTGHAGGRIGCCVIEEL